MGPTNQSVKIVKGEHIRRIFLVVCSYESLLAEAGLLPSAVVTYLDEDGDVLTVSSTPELHEAFRVASQQVPCKTLRLIIGNTNEDHVTGADSDAGALSDAGAVSDVNTVSDAEVSDTGVVSDADDSDDDFELVQAEERCLKLLGCGSDGSLLPSSSAAFSSHVSMGAAAKEIPDPVKEVERSVVESSSVADAFGKSFVDAMDAHRLLTDAEPSKVSESNKNEQSVEEGRVEETVQVTEEEAEEEKTDKGEELEADAEGTDEGCADGSQKQESAPLLNITMQAVHVNVACCECGVSPIRGVRFRCVVCDDYERCAACEDSNAISPGRTHHDDHGMLKIRVPLNSTERLNRILDWAAHINPSVTCVKASRIAARARCAAASRHAKNNASHLPTVHSPPVASHTPRDCDVQVHGHQVVENVDVKDSVRGCDKDSVDAGKDNAHVDPGCDKDSVDAGKDNAHVDPTKDIVNQAEPDGPFATEMAQLASMGCVDVDHNLALLLANDGDLHKVLDRLAV